MRPFIVKQLDYDLTPVAGLSLVGHHLKRLEPVLSFGAGILYLAAEGHEMAPYIGGNAYRISAAADAGVGLRMPLRPRRVELGFELHALVAEPYPVVRFTQSEVARAGRPSLLASITLLGGI